MQKADPEDKSGAYVTATAVTTRTATTHEDLGKNAKTQQLEEKTVATTTTHNLNRQEQRVVTQEVKTTATVTSGEQVGAAYAKPKPSQAKENMYSSKPKLIQCATGAHFLYFIVEYLFLMFCLKCMHFNFI